jgi:hypothetical protein
MKQKNESSFFDEIRKLMFPETEEYTVELLQGVLREVINKLPLHERLKDIAIEAGEKFILFQKDPDKRLFIFALYYYFLEKYFAKLCQSLIMHKKNKSEYYLRIEKTRYGNIIRPQHWFKCYVELSNATRILIFDNNYISLFWDQYVHYCEKADSKKKLEEPEKLDIGTEIPDLKRLCSDVDGIKKVLSLINEKLKKLNLKGGSSGSQKQIIRIADFSGIRWRSITITFISDDKIKITAPNHESIKTNYKEMGFAKKNGKSNIAWEHFKILAMCNGEIQTKAETKKGEARQRQYIKLIRDNLRQKLNLDEDPFYDAKKLGLYKIKFTLISETSEDLDLKKLESRPNILDEFENEIQEKERMSKGIAKHGKYFDKDVDK